VSAFAARTEPASAADKLHTLGLFQGTGSNADGTPNYDLARTPTRAEAVTMLVRLLGKVLNEIIPICDKILVAPTSSTDDYDVIIGYFGTLTYDKWARCTQISEKMSEALKAKGALK
jgi:hypothetical protein